MKKTFVITTILFCIFTNYITAAVLSPSDLAPKDHFGWSVSMSGSMGLVSSSESNYWTGSVYLFRNVDTANGSIQESVKLVASDADEDVFGYAVSLDGSMAIIGAPDKNSPGKNYAGAAYLYRNLDTANGTITEDVKLMASDFARSDNFGSAVSLDGTTALVGALGKTNSKGDTNAGAVYLYRNLDTATGSASNPLYQNAKLMASDSAKDDKFGCSVSLDGSIGLVGAFGKNSNEGAAYLFRNLDSVTGNATEDVKLMASDSAVGDKFGVSVVLDGTTALIGASGKDSESGAVYLYRDLDTAIGAVANPLFENAKLTASDSVAGDNFGNSVSLDGSVGLVGAYRKADSSGNTDVGAVYLFSNLDSATGEVNEDIKITASDPLQGALFGSSVSLDGDDFLIGSYGDDGFTGKTYSGSVSSITTLDNGTSKVISGISFESRTDWIIGKNNGENSVTLSVGDTANVTSAGKAIYIGQNAGSNNNKLYVYGIVVANEIVVGGFGNFGNQLYVGDTGNISDVDSIYLHRGSSIYFENEDDFLSAFLGVDLYMLDEDDFWSIVSTSDYEDYIDRGILEIIYDENGMLVRYALIPEPSSFALILAVIAIIAYYKRK